ncbi:MAG: hypothetical protein M3O86_02385, partial [Actinomycetota bacterium]|nr:hypothetical protein [Actinomycetota bacterium]
DLAFAEATARRQAARRTSDELKIFDDLPALRRETVERARRTVAGWEQEAIAELDQLDAGSGSDSGALHARQVRTLGQAASRRELRELVDTGLLPEQALSSADTGAVPGRR